MRHVLPILGVFASLCWSCQAKADEHGFYCIGPGYLAYEINHRDKTRQHRLHIVRLTRDQSPIPRFEFDLPDFQVIGMACNTKWVQITAWDSSYKVTWSDLDFGGAKLLVVPRPPGPATEREGADPANLVSTPNRTVEMAMQGVRVTHTLQSKIAKHFPEHCEALVVAKLWKHDFDVTLDEIVLLSDVVPLECSG